MRTSSDFRGNLRPIGALIPSMRPVRSYNVLSDKFPRGGIRKYENIQKCLCHCVISMTVLIALASSGCASILHGGKRTVSINTVPAGATASVTKANGTETVSVTTTPTTVTLNQRAGFFKGQSYNVKLELAGYNTVEVPLKATISGWYFGNILFGGLIGILIVDPATGAMWNLSPDKIDRTLSAKQISALQSGTGFVVVMLEQATESEKTKMVRVN